MVASPPRWHGPQVRAPEHHGAMGPSTSWDPWPRPAARAAVGMQECTQIGEDGLSAQPPPACRVRPLVRPTRKVRLSVTSPVQSAPLGHVAVASSAQSASFRETAVAEWGTCARCCDAIRRGVNPHEPPKSHLCARIYGKGVSVGGREADRPDWPFLTDGYSLGKAYVA